VFEWSLCHATGRMGESLFLYTSILGFSRFRTAEILNPEC
jgi:hypothetical protein